MWELKHLLKRTSAKGLSLSHLTLELNSCTRAGGKVLCVCLLGREDSKDRGAGFGEEICRCGEDEGVTPAGQGTGQDSSKSFVERRA